MLHLGDDDLVAHPESESCSDSRVDPVHGPRRRGVAEGVGHEVQGFGGVLGEHHLLGLRADETSHRLASGLKGVGRFFGELMGTAMNRRVVLLVERALGVQHLARFV